MPLRPLDTVLQNLLNQKAWEHQKQFREITLLWQELLPKKTAANSRPYSIKNNTLLVTTRNNTWSQHLTLQRLSIRKKLNQKLTSAQTIKEIRFTTAHWQQKPAYSPLADPDLPHPSRLENPQLKSSRSMAQSPANAVRSWLQQQQKQLRDEPVCPSCNVPTPHGELERWHVCRCCIAQEWSRNRD